MPDQSSKLAKILGLFVLASLVLSACSPQAAGRQPTPTTIPTQAVADKPVYTVARGAVVREASFLARISAVKQEELYFKTAGRVAKVNVKEGDVVKQGQVLAELEQLNTFDLRRAELNLQLAQYQLQLAQIQTPQYKAEYPVIIGMKQAQVELAQIDLDELKQKMENATITAGMDGTVVNVNVAEDTLAEPYKAVITIIDPSQLEASADLVGEDVKQLQENLPVTVEATSGPSQVLEGTIRRLPYPYGSAPQSGTGSEKSDSATHVAINGDLEKANFTLGTLVRVRVTLEKRDNALWLPPQAVRNFSGRRFVLVKEANGQRQVDVKVGLVTEERVEILEGLSEGQVVIAP